MISSRTVTKYTIIILIAFVISVGGVLLGLQLPEIISLVGNDNIQSPDTDTGLILVGGTIGVIIGSVLFGIYWLISRRNDHVSNHEQTIQTSNTDIDSQTTQNCGTDQAGSSEPSNVERTDEVMTNTAEDEHIPDTIENISGVGRSKANALRAGSYDSVSSINAASQKELAEVDGIGSALAGRIKAETGTTDSPVSSTPKTSEQGFADHQAAAETAIETAFTAKSNGELSEAVAAYSEAISGYQTALDFLDSGADKQHTEIEQAIESIRADLETVTTLQEHRKDLIEALQPAERSFQEAVVAASQASKTVARIRFRQARDAFENARKTIAESEENLFTDPIEVTVQPDRELSSGMLNDLAAIPETAAAELVDAGIETVEDLGSGDESPWTPAAVEELVASDAIDQDIATSLTLLSWWHGDETYELDTTEAIERRHEQADYGFNCSS